MNKLIALILFFLPFQTQWIVRAGMVRGEGWQYGTIGIFAVDILIACITLIEGWKVWHSPEPRGILRLNKIGVIGWWIAAFVISVLLSIIVAQDKSVAWLHAIWVVEAMALGCIIAHTTNRRSAQIAFCVGSVVQAVLGLWQFFSQSTIASSLLGIAAHPVWEGGTSVIELAGERWLRAYAGFSHPNVFGGWMVIAIIFIVDLIVSESRVIVRRILLGMLILLSAGLGVSFSRSAWIALLVGMVVIGILRFRHCEPQGGVAIQKYNKKLFACSAIIGISIIAVLFPYRALLVTRVQHSARLEQLSLNERTQQYDQAWEILRTQSWIKGRGLQGVAGAGNYTLEVATRHPDLPIWNVQPVHNVFVLIASEMHASSLIWLVLIFYYCLKRALGITPLSSFKRHVWKQLRDPQSALPLALLTALIPLLLLDHYLWSLHTGLLLVGVTLGCLWAYRTSP